RNLPETQPRIAAGTPGDVLRRRPDIRAAERRLAAANARIGVATADLSPGFTLDGLIGPLAGGGSARFTAGAQPGRVARGARRAPASPPLGVAAAARAPARTLHGPPGSPAGGGSALFTAGAQTGRVALGIDWSFLARALVQSRIDAADARHTELLANYRQTVLSALEETETWLLRYDHSQQRTALLRRATDAATQAVNQARERYDQGFIGDRKSVG